MSITNKGIELVARLETPEQVDDLMRRLKIGKAMIIPIVGAMDTDYTDDEEGREAEERDRKLNEEIDPEIS